MPPPEGPLGWYKLEFLKADVNMHLLALILAVIAAFAGFGVYYHNRLNEMQDDYDKKIESLKEIEQKLLLKEEKLNEIFHSKSIIEMDKETLEMGYLALHSENENLKTEKTSLMQDLYTRPFGKALCKATGNAECLN